jgi:hypothetical protein
MLHALRLDSSHRQSPTTAHEFFRPAKTKNVHPGLGVCNHSSNEGKEDRKYEWKLWLPGPIQDGRCVPSLGNIYRPFSRPSTSALDSIPNIGFLKSLMMAQLYAAREGDASA